MAEENLPDGIFSLLDTDLYKLTMQCAVLKYFPSAVVEYAFTNRTPDMRLNNKAFKWLEEQVEKLGNISISPDEIEFLKRECPYLDQAHLEYLQGFRLRPSEQVKMSFENIDPSEFGELHIVVKGLWVETILYEIPLLALTSEAYFKFCNTDWDHSGQETKAYHKGLELLEHGCLISEFGSRRRRDYKTQDLVVKGLVKASQVTGLKGTLTGTSNVHFAMKHGTSPVGTVAHEWYMGIAAITNKYEKANELGLSYWVGCFGEGVLGIALTDTFGTPDFFRAFKNPAVPITAESEKLSPPHAALGKAKSYADIFTGIRQDSGDPVQYVKQARNFYNSIGITDTKVLVFSDSLNIERCIEYKKAAEDSGFQPSFGVGTFFTNDFVHKSDGKKSVPLNIVIKLSKAGGNPAIKISDNIGKNTGDSKTVQDVKKRLGYVEKDWVGGDEAKRWGKEGELIASHA